MDSWLRHYGNVDAYRWRRDGNVFQRPLGFVEFSFDADGRYFEGRADMSCQLDCAVKSQLSTEEYRERVLLAWTRLRCQHLLLRAQTLREASSFALRVEIHDSLSKAVESAGGHLVFLADHYDHVDDRDFYLHCQNTSRVVNPDVALAKVFVFPITTDGGEQILRFHFVLAHQIADGISVNLWMRSFVKFLNDPIAMLKADIRHSISVEAMERRLPPPQEALYPSIPDSKARQRWFWVITRILRHVRRPHLAGFTNPMQRTQEQGAIPLSSIYSAVLNYERIPCVNSVAVDIQVPAAHTERLRRLTRAMHASLGAGIYAMVAVCLMELYEQREPNETPAERKSFIAGFPLNPRAFFGFDTDPDSMMLAFSDGISLPFLPSRLRLAGRLRLLTRQAQRQLSAYQKRLKPVVGEAAAQEFLTSRGAGLVLANQYLYSIERAETIIPGTESKSNVQGQYPARQNTTPQTCGVSSVGNRDLQICAGVYDVASESTTFAADFRALRASVRARPGEFLVGISGTRGALSSTPSIDMSRLDPSLVDTFKQRFETILADVEVDGDRPRL